MPDWDSYRTPAWIYHRRSTNADSAQKQHIPRRNIFHYQRLSAYFCGFNTVFPAYGSVILQETRTDRSKGISYRSNKIYGKYPDKKKAASYPWGKSIPYGICQSGTQPEQNHSCLCIAGFVRNTAEYPIYVRRWI